MDLDLPTAAADLFLGAVCPGCGRPSRSLCAACLALIAPRPAIIRTRPVRVAASGEHDGVLRESIVAWKEEGRDGLLRPLAHLLAASVVEVVGGSSQPIVLVPVPTTWRSRLARGADVVDQLARAASHLLRDTGIDVTVHQPLRVARRTADQSGLGARARARNLAGAFALRSTAGLPRRDIVVVDDIVTTGATLHEATRALRLGGHAPMAAATVAHRPLL
jgi:ComF family protein